MDPSIIAIDGPAGAGKSTIARRVADRLGWALVDTGAIYRAVALLAHERGVQDEDRIAALVVDLDLSFDGQRVFLGERDVTTAIRTPEISMHASHVSAMPAVRRALLEVQRRIALSHPEGAVLEGRDIGTVVFPDAGVKVFLTASIEERARRRAEELRARGAEHTHAQVREAVQARDHRDSRRSVSPLKAADDAVVIDTTDRDVDEIVAEIVTLARGEQSR